MPVRGMDVWRVIWQTNIAIRNQLGCECCRDLKISGIMDLPVPLTSGYFSVSSLTFLLLFQKLICPVIRLSQCSSESFLISGQNLTGVDVHMSDSYLSFHLSVILSLKLRLPRKILHFHPPAPKNILLGKNISLGMWGEKREVEGGWQEIWMTARWFSQDAEKLSELYWIPSSVECWRGQGRSNLGSDPSDSPHVTTDQTEHYYI